MKSFAKFVVGLTFLGVAQPAVSNELMRVYTIALSSDPEVQQYRSSLKADREGRLVARSSLLPQISGGYGYSDQHYSTRSSASTVDTTTGLPLVEGQRNIVDVTSRALSVTLEQTIFDWAAISKYKQSFFQTFLAEASLRAAEQDLLLRTAKAYFGILAATDGIEFAEAESAAAERQLEQAKLRFEEGVSAEIDVQQAQGAFDLSAAHIIQAQQQIEKNRQDLHEITGDIQVNASPLRDEFLTPEPTPNQINKWVDQAVAGNPSLLVSKLQTRISEQDVQIARSGYLPSLSLGASYGNTDSDQDDRFSGNVSQDRINTSVGLNLRVPIYTGGATSARIGQAKALLEKQTYAQTGRQRRIETETRDAYLGVVSGIAQIKALKQAVFSNMKSLEASEFGCESGTRTTYDVISARRDLFEAKRSYAASRYNYVISVLALKAAAGSLSESDLTDVDALLKSSVFSSLHVDLSNAGQH